ncbi:hypothetical protein ACN42_g2828 [Penicillium freii]|uniref:UBC core domain-containing protein n=1 Tax=Penicillium freii TaxID=48697 RepID=A0A101MPD2_PENFR|nr:hypothetical protein ACN42_g2828 [Penicillium freii]
MGDQCTLRLVRELRQVERSEQLAFTVRYEESNIRDIQALIMGPPGTPYELGFYEFSIKIPSGKMLMVFCLVAGTC